MAARRRPLRLDATTSDGRSLHELIECAPSPDPDESDANTDPAEADDPLDRAKRLVGATARAQAAIANRECAEIALERARLAEDIALSDMAHLGAELSVTVGAIERAHLLSLAPGELRVLQARMELIAERDELPSKQAIADRLGVSRGTVGTHDKRIAAKLAAQRGVSTAAA